MRIGFVGLGTAALFLTGCSSQLENMSQSRYEVDSEYMSKVEHQARMGRNHVTVYWINPPRKEKSSEGEEK